MSILNLKVTKDDQYPGPMTLVLILWAFILEEQTDGHGSSVALTALKAEYWDLLYKRTV